MSASVFAGDDPVSLVERVAAHVKARFLAESSGHDWHHINRVWKLARQIAVQEGANPEVAELGALVHDIADWKFHGGDDTVGPREAELLLTRICLSTFSSSRSARPAAAERRLRGSRGNQVLRVKVRVADDALRASNAGNGFAGH